MLAFWPSDAVLIGVQASLVAAPMPAVPAPLVRLVGRLRSSAWAAVLPVPLGGTVALLAVAPGAATAYTWLALVAVPVLAVPAAQSFFGSLSDHPDVRSRLIWPGALAVAGVLFLVAWKVPGLGGQGAALALTAGSCLTLAAWVGELAPVVLLKLGIVAMATLDAVLVFGQLLEGPNDHLNSAAPAAGLPQLQFASFGSALVGYGDLFVATVLGAVLAKQSTGLPRLAFAAATLIFSAVFDLLFLVVDVLPATVPVALVLVVAQLVERIRSGRGTVVPAGSAPAEPLVDGPRPRQ